MKGSTRSKLIKLLKELERRKREAKEKVRPALIKKQKIVEEIKNLFGKYRVVALIDLERVPTPEYKRIKRRLEEYGFIRVYKNSLFLRAMKELGLRGIKELSQYLTGTNAFMFTNMNPFELALMLDKIKEMRYAKPGDTASDDIYVPQGSTGIPPGPMLSIFGKLRIPTQVREGIIWIAKEVRVAKAGDKISPELASLLRKLDLKVIEVKLKLKAVWDNGLVIPSEKLKLDLESYKNDLLSALNIARNVAIEAAIPLPEVLPNVLVRAVRSALGLSSEAGFITTDNITYIYTTAIARATALASHLAAKAPDLGLEVTKPPTPPKEEKVEKEEEKEEEEKKEEVSEEEIAEGIASLFG